MRLINSVFCFLPLDTGAVFIGWASLIFNMFAAALLTRIINGSTFYIFYLVSILLLSTSVVHVASSILVIIGSTMKNPNFMLPWLFGQVLEIVLLIGTGFYLFLTEEPNYFFFNIGILVYLHVHLYFLLCIYSFYYKILGQQRKEAYKRLQEIRKRQTILSTSAAIN